MKVNKIDIGVLESERRFHAQQEDVPGMSAAETKEFFDFITREKVLPKLNETIDELNNKAVADDVYTMEAADELLSQKADSEQVYTKTESDALLSQKADAELVYTKAQADTMLSENQNAVNNSFCNAVKGTAQGRSVTITDASPVTHYPEIRLFSKNRIDITKAYFDSYFKNFLKNLTTDNNTLRFEKSYDGAISAGASIDMYLEAGSYVFSCVGETDGEGNMAFVIKRKNGGAYGGTHTIGKSYQEYTEKIVIDKSGEYTFTFYIGYEAAKNSYVSYSNLMLEKSDVKTEYVPYIDVSGAYVTKILDSETVHTSVADADGYVRDIESSPEFTVSVLQDNVYAVVNYNRDINKVLERLLNQ